MIALAAGFTLLAVLLLVALLALYVCAAHCGLRAPRCRPCTLPRCCAGGCGCSRCSGGEPGGRGGGGGGDGGGSGSLPLDEDGYLQANAPQRPLPQSAPAGYKQLLRAPPPALAHDDLKVEEAAEEFAEHTYEVIDVQPPPPRPDADGFYLPARPLPARAADGHTWRLEIGVPPPS